MRAVSWKIVLLLLFLCTGINGNVTCPDPVSINCNPYDIIITGINATSPNVENILMQCNAQPECEVHKPSEGCVSLNHFCRKSNNVLEVKGNTNSSRSAKTLLSIVSEGYRQRECTNAQSIICSLQIAETKDEHTLQITLNEFYGNSDFCFHVKNSGKEPICAGTEVIHTSYGPFKGPTGWQFYMDFLGSTVHLPVIRFWIDIRVSPDDSMYTLECQSKPVSLPAFTESLTSEKKNVTTRSPSMAMGTLTIVAVLGGLLLLAVVALAVGAALTCRKKKVRRKRSTSMAIDRQSCKTDSDPPYVDIDVGPLAIQIETTRREKSLENIASSRAEMFLLGKSLELIPGSSIQDRKLPSPPRERQHYDEGSKITQDENENDMNDRFIKAFEDDEYLPPIEEKEDRGEETNIKIADKKRTDIGPGEPFGNENENEESKEPLCRVVVSNIDEECNIVLPNADQDSEEQEQGEENVTENEYSHLSQESLVDVGVDSSQNSTASAYVRLPKKEGTDETDKQPEDQKQCNEKTDGNTTDGPGEVKPEDEVAANEILSDSEKIGEINDTETTEVEPKYLVLIAGDEELQKELEPCENDAFNV